MQRNLQTSENEQAWVSIEDPVYTRTILHAFGDNDKKNILMALSSPKTINAALTKCNIPKTSGYRKINSLINEGLIIAKDFGYSEDNKRITAYVSMFSDLKIGFVKNKMTVKIRPNKNLEKYLH
jgi:predicted DNA-binding ArsR family transcriptional regulator